MKKNYLILFALIVSISLNAQWTSNASQNTLIPNSTHNNYNTRLVPDGTGGVIIINRVKNSNTNNDLVAQKINANGVVQWQTNGVLICSSTVYLASNAITDGAGGAIISWIDTRNSGSSLYLQRIDSAGSIVWTSNGILIASTAYTQPDESTTIVSDGNGGAIVCWTNLAEFDLNKKVLLQRVNSVGTLLWNSAGVAVANTPFHISQQITSDNANGVIVIWYDIRNGSGFNLFAQRFDGNGNALWASNGITILSLNTNYHRLYISSDNNNGAVISWCEKRNGIDDDIFAQHIGATGNILWATNGVSVVSGTGDQDLGYIGTSLYDSSGSTYISFNNYNTSGSTTKLFLQRLDTDGVAQWGQNGIPCSSLATDSQGDDSKIISDNNGGIIACWSRYTGSSDGKSDLYAQRFNNIGSRLWGTNDIAISTALKYQDLHTMISNGNGGAIIGWNDYRNDPTPSTYLTDIYVQNICASGQLGENCTLSTNQNNFKNEISLYPNPTTGIINIGNENLTKILIYDISGKIIKELEPKPQIDLSDISKGTYFIKLISDKGIMIDKIIKI